MGIDNIENVYNIFSDDRYKEISAGEVLLMVENNELGIEEPLIGIPRDDQAEINTFGDIDR